MPTIWEQLAECVGALDEPFAAAEIVSWVRRHYPETLEQSLRVHLQGATSNAPSRGQFATRPPLVTRIDHGTYVRAATDTARPAPPPATPTSASKQGEWHQEANVQASVVRHLAVHGYDVLAVANTQAREHGIDVLAAKDGARVGIEVKGYPSKTYADPRRASEQKRTAPPTQARMWFASALMSAMRLRSSQPQTASVIAVPDFQTYRNLARAVAWSLEQCEISVWFVGEDGTVSNA